MDFHIDRNVNFLYKKIVLIQLCTQSYETRRLGIYNKHSQCDFFFPGEKWLEDAVERWNKRHLFRTFINSVNFVCTILAVIRT